METKTHQTKNSKEPIFKKIINKYLRHKTGEHEITIDGKRLNLNVFLTSSVEENQGYYKHVVKDGKSQYTIHSKEFINQLSPDNIDTPKFWKNVVNAFPMHSISGCDECNTVKDIHKIHLQRDTQWQNVAPLHWVLKEFKNPKILEIGPGYGTIKKYYDSIAPKKMRNNYYAIDVNPLFKYNKLFKTNGHSIPNQIPKKLHCVLSLNVFQHLTKKQRSAYYQEAFQRLVPGGYFIFTMFTVTDENVNEPLWGHRDATGRRYTFFFQQLTEVDYVEETIGELKVIGFHKVLSRVHSNHGQFICQK